MWKSAGRETDGFWVSGGSAASFSPERRLINDTQHFINDDSDILLKEEVDNMKTHEV